MDKGGGETFDGVSPPPSHVDGESSTPSPSVTQVSPKCHRVRTRRAQKWPSGPPGVGTDRNMPRSSTQAET